MNGLNRMRRKLMPLSIGRLVPVGRSGDGGRLCPACGGRDLSRIRRRPVDRLVSLFFRVRRYRCCKFGCNWEGALKVR